MRETGWCGDGSHVVGDGCWRRGVGSVLCGGADGGMRERSKLRYMGEDSGSGLSSASPMYVQRLVSVTRLVDYRG